MRPRNRVGRPIGSGGGKKDHVYSDNPNTARERNRLKNLTAEETLLFNAKKADSAAQRRAIHKVTHTEEYKLLSEAEQKSARDDAAANEMKK